MPASGPFPAFRTMRLSRSTILRAHARHVPRPSARVTQTTGRDRVVCDQRAERPSRRILVRLADRVDGPTASVRLHAHRPVVRVDGVRCHRNPCRVGRVTGDHVVADHECAELCDSTVIACRVAPQSTVAIVAAEVVVTATIVADEAGPVGPDPPRAGPRHPPGRTGRTGRTRPVTAGL